MVALYVGNTDNSWFDFLRSHENLEEVNFWQPSAKRFQAIGEGELFAFRLKSPRNVIGGFGVFSSSSTLPIDMAWQAFGQSNGTATLDELVGAISRYRRDELVSTNSFIGCRILVQPVLFPEDMWFDVPESWSRNIVTGKRFDTDNDDGRRLWDQLQDRAQAMHAPILSGFSDGAPRYGKPGLTKPRLGQGAFRVAVLEAYGRKCAFTGGKVLPALEAAHIRPYAAGGPHEKSNGVFLRRDIHSVFDAGYLTIDTDQKIVVSGKVRDVFNNGEEYRRLHGLKMTPPANPADHPSAEALRWHNDRVFVE